MVALTPFPVAADSIDIGDVTVFAFANSRGPGSPITLSDTKIGPPGSSNRAEVLIGAADGIRFPNFGAGPFASAAADANGIVATGVNQSSFRFSDPPNSLGAQAGFSQQIINNTSLPVTVDLDLHIPAPTLRFVMPETPPGALQIGPRGDAQARAIISTELIHPDGSRESAAPFLYGLGSSRNPQGVLVAVPDEPGDVVTRFDGPDGATGSNSFLGSFGFRLPDRVETDLRIAEIGPGDILSYTYSFNTFANAGWELEAAFAQIGDPFDLNLTGGRFDLHISDAAGPVTPTSSVPEPGTLATLGAGLLLLGCLRRRQLAR